jgi:hypothetical protein
MKSGRILDFLNASLYDILLLVFHHRSGFILNIKFILPRIKFCQKIGTYDMAE